MATDEMIRIMEAEITTLKKALENYVVCRHGEQHCRCTMEARAALYPYAAKAAKAEQEQPQ
jgi:hypothetical protein